MIKTINQTEFKNLLNTQEYILIDVRTPVETQVGKINDQALEIDFYSPDFSNKINKLDKNKKYLIYCRSGNRTKAVLSIMKNLNFSTVYDLDGGIQQWKFN